SARSPARPGPHRGRDPGRKRRGRPVPYGPDGAPARMTQPLTPERILLAAEEVLRRHGPAKANVVDVARALGVSHGSVYRHFPSKQALREAVTQRWLESFHDTLDPIVTDGRPDRLRRWLHALF